MLAFTAREETETEKATARRRLRDVTETHPGFRVRRMNHADLDRILELRSVVRWSADPRAFDLLRGLRGARWAVAEAPDGSLAGMVGAVPLEEIGILCHLAVHDGHRGSGLGAMLSDWAVAYLKSRGARTIRLTRRSRPRDSTARSVSRRSRRAPCTGWRRNPGRLACQGRWMGTGSRRSRSGICPSSTG